MLDESGPTQDAGADALEPAAHTPQPPLRNSHLDDLPPLPIQQEAFKLLEMYIFITGYTQNLVDVREISDNIGLLYANGQDFWRNRNLPTLQILFILAISKLFKGECGDNAQSTDRECFPGYSLFDFAYQRLPSLSQLYSVGKVGVEILALVAVYLVNVNRKEEAYIHVCPDVSSWTSPCETL